MFSEALSRAEAGADDGAAAATGAFAVGDPGVRAAPKSWLVPVRPDAAGTEGAGAGAADGAAEPAETGPSSVVSELAPGTDAPRID